jgi:hypothetical protein
MNSRSYSLATGLLAVAILAPAQVLAFCNTTAGQTKAVSAYALSGQGNFSCASLNMGNATIIWPAAVDPQDPDGPIPEALPSNGVNWRLADPQEVDVVAVADSSGKRCVYNYGPGAIKGFALTPNSSQPATQVIACKDGLVQEAPNTAPVVTIDGPDGVAESTGGVPVNLSATAIDKEDGNITTIFWTSSLDGSLDADPTVSTTISPILSTGTHVITAQATDSDGLLGSASVEVIVAGVVVPQCQSDGQSVLINGVQVSCPIDPVTNMLLPRVVCSADVSPDADRFSLATQQGCCVCGVQAVECDPSLPASDENACPNPFVADTGDIDVDKVLKMQVPTSIMFNNDPYYCVTSGGKQTCYRY